MLDSNPSWNYYSYFLSPEELKILRGQDAEISSKSDVYTIGTLLLNLATLPALSNLCYNTCSRSEASLNTQNQEEKMVFVSEYYSGELAGVLLSMLEENPEKRVNSLKLNSTVEEYFERQSEKRQKYS